LFSRVLRLNQLDSLDWNFDPLVSWLGMQLIGNIAYVTEENKLWCKQVKFQVRALKVCKRVYV
jgi:hypothetical protein